MLERDQKLKRARRLLLAADEWHSAHRQTFEIALAHNWQAFISDYGGGDQFLLLPGKLQQGLLCQMNDRYEHYFQIATVEKDFAPNAMCFSLFLISIYLNALIEHDSATEDELAPRLDKHLKSGWSQLRSFEISPGAYKHFATSSDPILFERNRRQLDVD